MIRIYPDCCGCYFTNGKGVDYLYFVPGPEAADRVARLLGAKPESVRVVRYFQDLKGK